MPYSADIRTGPGKCSFNVDWFYEELSSYKNEELILLNQDGEDIQNPKDGRWRILHSLLDEWVQLWIDYKAFNWLENLPLYPATINTTDEKGVPGSAFDNWFDFCYENLIELIKLKPQDWKLISTEEEENELTSSDK